MLSLPDRELVRRDPAVPGLPILLDPDAFAAALSKAAPFAGIRAGRITYLRYKPGISCLAGYQVQTATGNLHVTARALRPVDEGKLHKAQQQPGASGPLGPGRFLLPGLATAVSVFPNDWALKGLARVVDQHAREELLHGILPERPELWSGELDALIYKPERRFVARLRGADQSLALLKVHALREYAGACDSAASFRSCGPLRVARRLGRSNHHHIVIHEWLWGDLLSGRLSDETFDLALGGSVGAALAELHRQTSKRLPQRPIDNFCSSLHAMAVWLGFVCPYLKPWALAVADELAERLKTCAAALGTMHGDFHAGQVLLGDDHVAILDLDEAARGASMADLGNFCAHLEARALRGHFPAGRIGKFREALLEGYAQASQPPDLAAVELHTAAALLRLTPHAFRDRTPDWPEQAETLLGMAENILRKLPGRVVAVASDRDASAASNLHDLPVHDPFGCAQDQHMPFLRQALDPGLVQERLQRHCIAQRLTGQGDRVQAWLQAIRVIRHKRGRRCVIEYDLSLEGQGGPTAITLMGKVRCWGTDQSTFHVTWTLWEGEFGNDSADGISVPEPVGFIPEFRMWLQRKVAGIPATDLLPGSRGVALARQAAEVIHKLHQAGAPAAEQHDMTDELYILRDRLLRLARLQPQWATRLERLLEVCEQLGASVPAPTPVGIHRDFYADHILVDGSRLLLLDLDLYCLGDAALDAGNFLGHMTDQALRLLGNPDALADSEAAMEERFLELTGPHARSAVRVYALLTLARHVFISSQFVERRPFTESLLELCEERLGIASRPRSLALCGGLP